MKRWPTKLLGELCDVRIGRTPRRDEPRFWGGDAVWVTIRELNGGVITTSKEMVSAAAVRECMPEPVPIGTLLFSFKLSIGKMAVAGCPLYTNEAIAALPIRDPAKLSRDFLRYALLAESHEGTANTAVLGKVLNKEKVQQLSISVPPLAEQERIVKLLDEADELRKLRARANRRTVDLIPSLFHEMFGDQNFPKVALRELATKERNSLTNGPFGSDLLSSELTDSGVPVIYIRDISSGNYERKSRVCVTPAKASELEFCTAKPGDVLVAKVGAPPGIAAVYPVKEPHAIVTQDVIRIRLNVERALPVYVEGFLNSSLGLGEVRNITIQATRQRFSLGQFKEIKVPLPPLSPQKEFAARVSEIHAMEVEQAVSRRRLDELFKSVLYRAFNGEL